MAPRLPPFDLLLHGDRGPATSIYCIDSTRLAVCHNARTSGDRVLWGLARRGRPPLGWFFGFKLRLVTTRADHGLQDHRGQ